MRVSETSQTEKFEEFVAMGDPDFRNNANIKWNFTKFVVDREGNV